MIENKTEKFIQIMESKIKAMESIIASTSKDNKIAIVMAMEYLDGLQVSLDLFKKLNDR